MIKVLHVIPGLEQGPSWIFAKRQVASLEQEGVQNRSFFLLSRTSPIVLVSEFFRFLRETRSFKPDIIHSHYGKMTALFCALEVRTPLVITFRGSDLNLELHKAWKTIPGILFSQIAALKASGLICVSRQLRSKLWWKKTAASIIPSGLDLEIFHPRSKEESCAALGWSPSEKVVLFSCREGNTVKRPELAEATLACTQKRLKNVRMARLDGTIGADEVAVWMNAADCLLVTSRTEGSPNVVKEALACNLPVVSTDVGDVQERLRGVAWCSVVQNDRPEELAEKLIAVLTVCPRSNGFGSVQHLSLEEMAKRTVSVYLEALSSRRERNKIDH